MVVSVSISVSDAAVLVSEGVDTAVGVDCNTQLLLLCCCLLYILCIDENPTTKENVHCNTKIKANNAALFKLSMVRNIAITTNVTASVTSMGIFKDHQYSQLVVCDSEEKR